MARTFLISDTHFGHQGILTFNRDDGTPLRPFSSVEEMDQTMVDNWNRVVSPKDLVYHLGDVAMNRRCIATVGRCNGRKKLVRGNHDIFKLGDFTPYFEDVMGCAVLKDMILTHIPLHPSCISTRFGTNVHGHLHGNRIMSDPFSGKIDRRYYSVCVEQIGYTPISLEQVRERIGGI